MATSLFARSFFCSVESDRAGSVASQGDRDKSKMEDGFDHKKIITFPVPYE